MAQSFIDSLASLVNRLTTLAREDGQLRRELRTLAQHVLEVTETEDVTAVAASASNAIQASPAADANFVPLQAAATAPDLPTTEAPPPMLASGQPLPELTLGQSHWPEAVSIPAIVRWTTPSDADFPIMEARCRLKAEGCRWAASRRRLIAEGAHLATEVEPPDREIIARAKALPECFLWMCNRNGPQPADLGLYAIAAACFDNLADALSVVKQVLDEPGLHENEFEPALDLLAEAQSAIRAIVLEMEGLADSDQLRAFNWLKATAAENQLFIQRHMRMDDAADPRGWPALAGQIDALDAILQKAQQKSKQRRKLLGKVRHKASLIAAEPEGCGQHWAIVIQTVEELLGGGLPPSNRELRDILLPVMELFPDIELPKGFGLVLRELDRYSTQHPAAAGAASPPEAAPSVWQVAALLAGKSLVLIGGERRPASQAAIVEAFGLKELIWIETRDHQSIAGFEPYIARPEVALALLAIRWSSHSFGDAKQFCDKHGKPLVRLPGGYNPGQIASQILSQCSERLRQQGGLVSPRIPEPVSSHAR